MPSTIQDVIKRIKRPTPVIDVNWIKEIQFKDFDDLIYKDHITEVIKEYIITREINSYMVEFLHSLKKRNKAKGEARVNKDINFFLRGEYGTGKSHFLTFLSLLLLDNEKLQKLFQENPTYKKASFIINYSDELRKDFKDSLLICPIKLTDYDNNKKLVDIIRFSLQEIAMAKYNDNNVRLFSVYGTIDWFKNELDPTIRKLVLNVLDSKTRSYINKDLEELMEYEFEQLIEIEKKLVYHYETKTKTKITREVKNKKLSDLLKESLITKKYNIKNIIIIVDELSQWWGSKPEIDLISQLHGLVEDFKSEVDLNISLITSYQKRLSTKEYITLKERLQRVWVLEPSEFKDIVPKRCLDQNSLNHHVINKISDDYAALVLNKFKLPNYLLKKYLYVEDDNINRLEIKENFQLFYPFHPSVFIPEIWNEIGKYSTETRGGMNIIVKLLEDNLIKTANNLICPSEVINEILEDIFENNPNKELFHRKIRNELELDVNSLEMRFILLLFIFNDGLSKPELNFLFLEDVTTQIENFYRKLIGKGIMEVSYETKSEKYTLSFETSINIDTYINQLDSLIKYENILNYLQYQLSNGDYCQSFINDRSPEGEKFNYIYLKNYYLNSDEVERLESEIRNDLEERETYLLNYRDKFAYINKFMDTSISDGYVYFLKPKFEIKENFINKIKDMDNVILAYTNKDLKEIQIDTYNLYELLKKNLILDILETVLNQSGDLEQTAANIFDDIFDSFEDKYQHSYMLNFSDITFFSEPLRKFFEVCVRSSTKIHDELIARRKNVPEIDEVFFKKFKELYSYLYNGRGYNNYTNAKLQLERKIHSHRLDPIDQNFNSTKINHILNCLRILDEYKAPSKAQKDTFNFYTGYGFFKKLPGDKFKVSLDLDKENLTPIDELYENLGEDPVSIKNILIDLRHSKYGLNLEYTLLSILALYGMGYIKILKLVKKKFEPFPQTEREKGLFCKGIVQLNGLQKYYISKGDLISSQDWFKLLDFIEFLKMNNLFPNILGFDIKNYQTSHNVDSEKKVFEKIKGLKFSKIRLLQGNIDSFINSIGFDDDIVDTFEFQEKLEVLRSFIENIIDSGDLDSIVDEIVKFDIKEVKGLKRVLIFFDEKFKEILNIMRALKQILGK